MKIKRPVAVISFSILAAFYVIITMPKSVVYLSLALFAMFIFFHRITQNRHTVALILSFASVVFAFVYFYRYNNLQNNRLSVLSEKENITAYAKVANKSNSSGSSYYTVKITAIDGKSCLPLKVNVYTDDFFENGDCILLTGKYKQFSKKSNYIYNYSQGIYGYFYANDISYRGKSAVTSAFAFIKNAISDKLKKLYDVNTIPVVMAMGLGDKVLISARISENFVYTGISHALVVSGLHVGFILAALSGIMYFIPINKKVENFIIIIFLFVFMGIIGFTPSVIRAGCLAIAVIIGKNCIVEIDNYTVLACIILFTILPNPYSSANASLLLSYSAYFGVIAAGKISTENNYGNLKTSLLLTVFAVLFTLPVMSMLGMNVTVLSPFFNLLLSPVIMIICLFSFFSGLRAFIPIIGQVINFVLVPINKFAVFILMIVASFAKYKFNFALINLGSGQIKIVTFCTLIAAAISFVHTDNKFICKTCAVFVSLFSLLCYNLMNNSVVTVKAFDSGSETSFYISYRGKDYLILTEDIEKDQLEYFIEKENISTFDEIIFCPENDYSTEIITGYTDKLHIIDNTDLYSNNVFTINAVIEKRSMAYVIDVCGVNIIFNHKRAKLENYSGDFYFFGSDTPQSVQADNSFYFYPLLKKHGEMVTVIDAKQLYGTLEIKINLKNGSYRIVKDVKNFGGRI